ncbi:enoyl-CoA hydratase-related protein [Pseudonocardia spinosispora]|uniref:enoyl-CoA hydratase-related protein n=1 Tax=Pseudonocardia spinosispora TaxID=103441 RepID=UPI0009FEF954|nr:enoyl-CoA hydratase-related protein [Pseudonocardia spinosispora]
MSSTETQAVALRRDGTTLHVTLDRPAKLNTLRPEDIRALGAAMELDPDVRTVVFRGAGDRAFTAGMHVDSFDGLTTETARAFISGLRDMLQAVRTAPVATICAVDGYCLGVGFELALACDIRVASTRSSFGLPEIKVGIPSVADAALLAQHVGLSFAKEMILTGDLYPLRRFEASGLCNEVVEPDALDGAVSRWVARVGGHTATATASQKRLFEIWQNTTLATGTALSVSEFASVFAAEETHTQLAAYRRNL